MLFDRQRKMKRPPSLAANAALRTSVVGSYWLANRFPGCVAYPDAVLTKKLILMFEDEPAIQTRGTTSVERYVPVSFHSKPYNGG